MNMHTRFKQDGPSTHQGMEAHKRTATNKRNILSLYNRGVVFFFLLSLYSRYLVNVNFHISVFLHEQTRKKKMLNRPGLNAKW